VAGAEAPTADVEWPPTANVERLAETLGVTACRPQRLTLDDGEGWLGPDPRRAIARLVGPTTIPWNDRSIFGDRSQHLRAGALRVTSVSNQALIFCSQDLCRAVRARARIYVMKISILLQIINVMPSCCGVRSVEVF